MTTAKTFQAFSQTVIAIAVLGAFGTARGQDLGELKEPGNSLSMGLGWVSGDEKDRARFGMFNGLREQKGYGLLGFSVVDRDSVTGKWFSVEGRNLGLDSREVGFSYRKLGDMKLWGEYSEVVRHDPRTINTGLAGAGSTTPIVRPLAAPRIGNELDLELKRKSFSLNGEKWFGNVQMEVNFKNEDKVGARHFGIGFSCTATSAPGCAGTNAAGTISGNAFFLLPEPVNSTIRQLDVKLNWVGPRLNMTAGYYGSWYTNNNSSMTPTIPAAGLVGILGQPVTLDPVLRANMQLPIALWPDNQAHQLYFSGNYRITPKTVVNFKYSYTHATQNEEFLNMGLLNAPASRTNLGGEVNITKAQVGFSAHPLKDLHLHGDLKYEDRNDKTPIALYNLEGANSFSNGQYSPRKTHGKLEAGYKLPMSFLVSAGLEYEYEDLGAFTQTVNVAGLSGLRQKHEEVGYRVELKKAMSETFNGSISYRHAKREGDSPWLKPLVLSCTGLGGLSNAGTGVIEANVNLLANNACATFNNGIGGTAASRPIFPFLFVDRDRDKLKAMATWSPSRDLELSFFVEDGKDKYSPPVGDSGLRSTSNRQYSIDLSYALSDKYRFTAYYSRGETETRADHSTGYDATLRDTADSIGIGFVGKPLSRLHVGGDLTYLNDKLEYKQNCDPLCSATNANFLALAGGLPNVTYKLLRLKLYGEYAVDKTSYVRLDLVHQYTLFNEWTYNFNNVPFFYSDNTTLSAKEKQRVTFIGGTYVYRFQ